MHILGGAEKFWHLACDNIEADAGQVAADHRIGHILDQPPESHHAKKYLQQPRHEPQYREHQYHCRQVAAIVDGLECKRCQHRCCGSARGRNEPVGTAQHRRNKTECGNTEDAC